MDVNVRSKMGAGVFEPTLIAEVELGSQLLALRARWSETGCRYTRARCLVRLHGVPLGMVDLDLAEGEVAPADYASVIWNSLEREIRAHLREDGLPGPDTLDSGGLPASSTPRCEQERAAFLEEPPFITVVVPTRDRPDRLERCLDSIFACVYPPTRYEIVVVDNCPRSDATAQLVRRLDRHAPTVRYAREDRSGSASARNTGLEIAEGELVAFTDDDVRVDRNWVVEIARGFEGADRPDCVTGLVVPTLIETQAQEWFEEYGGFSRSGFERRLFDLGENRPSNPLFPYAAGAMGSGNNMAFRRSVLRAVGAFDPALGNGTPAIGGVDNEAMVRLVLGRGRVLYEPSAFVWHEHRREYAALRRQIYGYGVGVSAYLCKTLSTNPRLIPDFLQRLPRGLAYVLSPKSPKHQGKGATYPRGLAFAEWVGLLYGPLAYVRSRRRFGPHR